MKFSNVEWCAGLLEGEGYFGTSGNSNSPRITCEMTDLDVLEKLQEHLGGIINKQKIRNLDYKPSWRWSVQNKDAVDVMVALRHLMLSRRRDKINQILEAYFDKREKLNTQQDMAELAHQEWLSGGNSLRALAKKYRLSHETIRRSSAIIKK